ncbi:MAG: HAMP domain-containing protein [Rubritepida sp.]|nr:HAMP domain-containing protein [Rubritepida sp.]
MTSRPPSVAAGDANKAYWTDTGAQVARQTALVLALTLLAIAAATALVWFVRRRVTRPAAGLAQMVERIAEGDLEARADLGHPPEEIARVAGALAWPRPVPRRRGRPRTARRSCAASRRPSASPPISRP